MLIQIILLVDLCVKPSTHQWCGIDKGGRRLGLSKELGCCAGNLHSGSIQRKMFCPEHAGKRFLKACDILQ